MVTASPAPAAAPTSESTHNVSQRSVTFQAILATKKVDKIRNFVLNEGFDPNKPLKNGALPLHYAVHFKAGPSVIQALLQKGAKPFSKDNAGFTAADHALLVGDVQTFTSLLRSICPLDFESIKQVDASAGSIAMQVHNARESMKHALSLLQRDKIEDLPEIFQKIIKGEDVTSSSDEQFALVDSFGLLPLHHAIREYGLQQTEDDKKKQLGVVEHAISRTKDLWQKTASSLSLVHYALLKSCPKAVELLLDDEKKRDVLLNSNTLTKLSALHVAFLMQDFDSAALIFKHAPQLLLKPDSQGLTPLQIFIFTILQQVNTAEQNIGSISKEELALFAMQCFAILANASCSAHCSDSVSNGLSTLLAVTIFSLENGQSQDRTSAIVQAGLEGYFKPAGATGLIFSGPRVWRVATKSFEKLQKSWHYASYAPLTAVKNSVVHLATAGITAGREILGWWYGKPASVTVPVSQKQIWTNTSTDGQFAGIPFVFADRLHEGATSY